MKRVFLTTILCILFVSGCSCSSEEKKWGAIELYKIAEKYDPNLSRYQMPPENSELYKVKSVRCEKLPPEGCIGIIRGDGNGARFTFKGLDFPVMRYDSTENACKAALEIGQWYSRDWIFDEVTDEPVLEDFIKKAYDAKRPTKPSDCEF